MSEKSEGKAREAAISSGDMAMQRNEVFGLRSRSIPGGSFRIGAYTPSIMP
jgi:hypothetical protein